MVWLNFALQMPQAQVEIKLISYPFNDGCIKIIEAEYTRSIMDGIICNRE